MARVIEVTVSPQGEVTVQTRGYAGGECLRASKFLEQALGAPQDIEWAIAPSREIFLLQARPETVWSQKSRPPLSTAGSTIMQRILQSMRVPRT